MSRAHQSELSTLRSRMAYLLALRLAFVALVVGFGALRPEVLGVSTSTLMAVGGVYAVGSAIGEWARRRGSRLGLALINLLLLADGIYLGWATYATGGTESPMRFLIYLHLVAVSLLASYRTGLKIALWHSLLLFVVLYAQAAQLIPAVDVMPGSAVEFDRMPVLHVTSFWLFALATSLFSALNERELRHRRADLQTLVDIGGRLDDVTDPVHQSQIVLDALADRFGFQRGLVIAASDGQMLVLASRGTATVDRVASPPDAIISRVWERRSLLAVKRLDAARNPVLAAALPDAGNLLISPLLADGRPLGAIVVEHHSRSVIGVERRVASVIGQISATAALNLRNAALLRHVQDLAERDPLTGAANRRMFQLSLERILATRDASSDAPPAEIISVLFIDLDDFKVVNDSLGHAVGDALLVAVTERIAGLVREGDLVARLGGDEFAVLTTDDQQLRRSLAIAERLTQELRVPFLLDGQQVTISASIGIATGRDVGDDAAAEVVRNADIAMYMAKANGKAGFALFDPGMHAAIRDRHQLGVELQQSVELGQLRVQYQPIVSFDSEATVGVEALVRWQHPTRGLLAPGEFIHIAEDNGAIQQIGRWVLREACRQAAGWSERRAAWFLAVNVSAREIQQPSYYDTVTQVLEETGLSPARLSLEITETALVATTPSTIATLERLRQLGIRIVIDDFGTGYFSLSHLRQFPVDMLKIASEFVRASEADDKSAALARAIVAMSHSLGIETVAEGIETAGQAARMRALGCTFGQGYLFARPLSHEDIADAGALPAEGITPILVRDLARRGAA